MKRVNIDWLQLSANGILQPEKNVTVVLKDFQTRHFKKVAEVFDGSLKIGTLMYDPHSKVLARDLHIFKLDNQFCYRENPIKYSCDILRKIGLTPTGITRLDLAIDFVRFDYRNTLPADFIKRFLSGRYLKLGEMKKYKLQGQQNETDHTFDYLRFGSNTSPIAVYMYNKSKEMEEVKMKPYIYDQWQKDGLTDTEEDVWRLEITLKGNKMKVVDKETANIIDVTIDKLYEDNTILERLFNAIVSKYFRFKLNDGKANKSRMKDIILFNDIYHCPDDIVIDRDKKDHTRSDKIFIRKLENVNNELRQKVTTENNAGVIDLLNAGEDFLSWFTQSRSLVEYYNNVVLFSDMNHKETNRQFFNTLSKKSNAVDLAELETL